MSNVRLQLTIAPATPPMRPPLKLFILGCIRVALWLFSGGHCSGVHHGGAWLHRLRHAGCSNRFLRGRRPLQLAVGLQIPFASAGPADCRTVANGCSSTHTVRSGCGNQRSSAKRLRYALVCRWLNRGSSSRRCCGVKLACFSCSNLTPLSSGHAPASRVMPLMSNVRPRNAAH